MFKLITYNIVKIYFYFDAKIVFIFSVFLEGKGQ